MRELCTKLEGSYDLFPIENDGTAWRWMAVIKWREPGDEFGRLACRRHPCPLKLMRWVYAVARRIHAEVAE